MSKEYRTIEQLHGIYTYVMSRLSQFPFILMYGSLLGLIREGEFIEGDDDVDVLLPFRFREKLLFAVKRLQIPITIEDVCFIQLHVENCGPFDVYLYEYRGNYIYNRWDNHLILKTNMFPLKQITIKGFTIHIPHQCERIFEEYYGPNWRIPDRK